MIHEEISTFASSLKPNHPLLGLDLGTKTIGLALSDRLWIIATADKTLKRTKFTADAAAIAAMLKEQNVTGIVLGLPKNMDGSEGPRAQSSRAFARNLVKFLGDDSPPILLWDERLSTIAAERAMLEADLSRKKRAQKIDALAASIILQGALDRLKMWRDG